MAAGVPAPRPTDFAALPLRAAADAAETVRAWVSKARRVSVIFASPGEDVPVPLRRLRLRGAAIPVGGATKKMRLPLLRICTSLIPACIGGPAPIARER